MFTVCARVCSRCHCKCMGWDWRAREMWMGGEVRTTFPSRALCTMRHMAGTWGWVLWMLCRCCCELGCAVRVCVACVCGYAV